MRVPLAFLDLSPLPLTNARAASVSQNCSPNLLKNVQKTVSSDGGSNLLATWSDGEGYLHVVDH